MSEKVGAPYGKLSKILWKNGVRERAVYKTIPHFLNLCGFDFWGPALDESQNDNKTINTLNLPAWPDVY